MTDPQNPRNAEFLPATGQNWRKLVDTVLKGAPFSRLQSRTADGIILEPLYGRDVADCAVAGRPPGTAWTLIQRVDHPDPAAANAQALDDLENGATGLSLVFAGSVSANGFGIDGSVAAIARVLDGIHVDAGIALDVDLAPYTPEVPQHVADAIRQRTDPAKTIVRFGYDPVTAFAISGKMPVPWSKLGPVVAGLIGKLADAGFNGPFAAADGRPIHNAGGSEAQELAYALSSAVLYLRALEAGGMTLAAARDAIYFRLTADTDEFLTVAKFRALRKLWARVEAACGVAPKPTVIAAETAWRTMTKRDAYANMLRITIATAAAGLGGADAVIAFPHTAALGLPDPFARRIARNTQLLLLEESNLFRVADPAAGSGAIEAITQKLCAAAWTLFQEIESAGGVWAALQAGIVQRHVAAVRAARERAIAHRTDILTGANDFPNLREAAASVLDVAPLAPPSPGTAALPVPRIRLAEPFEHLRERSDIVLARTGARPKVFLATLGKRSDFGPRANFARNFFEAGGIEAVGGEPESLVAAFKASATALVCLCGADQTYETEAASAADALKAAGAKHIYLAGRAGTREAALVAAGVQSFIDEDCDALATLNAAYDILGVNGRLP